MKCPFCPESNTRVIDSRLLGDGEQIRRRRECLSCRARFPTYETAELSLPRIVKNDGRREAFSEEKLRSGVVKALEKRPVDLEQIDHQVSMIKSKLRENGERELKSTLVGELVMEALKSLDHVAYVRFASVYRSFEDVKSFLEEVQRLEDELPESGAGDQLELIKKER